MTRGRVVEVGGIAVEAPANGPIAPAFERLLGALPDTTAAPAIRVRSSWATSLPARPAPDASRSGIFADDATGEVGANGAWLQSATLHARLDPAFRTLTVDAIDDGRPVNYDAAFLLFAIAMHVHGWTHVHGGGVELPDGRRVLLAGESGDGKTTTVLSLLLHGCAWGTDDCCFIHPGQGAPIAAFIPRVFHLRERTIEAFPALAPHLQTHAWRHGTRRALDPRSLPDTRMVNYVAPVDLVVLPRVTHTPTTTCAVLDAGDAMGRLLMASPYATIARLPDAQRAIDVLAALASHARCLDLALGWDALESPERLVALIASA